MSNKVFTVVRSQDDEFAYHLTEDLKLRIAQIASVLKNTLLPIVNISACPQDVESRYEKLIKDLDDHFFSEIVVDDEINPDDVKIVVDVMNWFLTNIVSTVNYPEQE